MNMTSDLLWEHICDVIGIGAGQTVYAVLHQFFSDIKNEILSTEISDFDKQINFLKLFNSMLYGEALESIHYQWE